MAAPPVAKPVARPRSSETRSRAIAAAVECLAELGYAHTTLQMIAQRAGMSHGPLQYHFRSKLDLMAAVAGHLLDGRRESFAPLVAPGSERGRVLSRYLGLSEAYCRTPDFLAALELLVAARGDAEIREAIARTTGDRRRAQQETFARLLAAKMGADPARLLAVTDLVASLASGLAISRSAGLLPGGREQAVWRLLSELVGKTETGD